MTVDPRADIWPLNDLDYVWALFPGLISFTVRFYFVPLRILSSFYSFFEGSQISHLGWWPGAHIILRSKSCLVLSNLLLAGVCQVGWLPPYLYKLKFAKESKLTAYCLILFLTWALVLLCQSSWRANTDTWDTIVHHTEGLWLMTPPSATKIRKGPENPDSPGLNNRDFFFLVKSIKRSRWRDILLRVS